MPLPAINADLIPCRGRKSWLAERRNRLHSTDCARGLADKEWLAVFADKTAANIEDEPEEWQRIKLDSETTVRKVARWKFGGKVHAWPSTTIAVSREYPWLACTPDGLLEDDQHDTPGDHQIKCWSELDRDTWRDGRPLYVQVQNQIELLVTGCTWGATDVMFGTQSVERFYFEPDPEFLALALPALKSFWDDVLLGKAPAPTASAASRAALRRLHPNDNGLTVQLDESADGWLAQYQHDSIAAETMQARADLARHNLLAIVGDNTFGVTPNGQWVSWKTNTLGYRVFGRCRPQGEIEYAPGSVRSANDYANAPAGTFATKQRLWEIYDCCNWCGETLSIGGSVLDNEGADQVLSCRACYKDRAFDVAGSI